MVAGVAGTCDAAEEVEAPTTTGGSVGGLGGLGKVGSAGDAALPRFERRQQGYNNQMQSRDFPCPPHKILNHIQYFSGGYSIFEGVSSHC